MITITIVGFRVYLNNDQVLISQVRHGQSVGMSHRLPTLPHPIIQQLLTSRQHQEIMGRMVRLAIIQ